ncbi:MAG TPA: Stf0 family sulfotransferase [Pirellulaceae bacterium]
MRHQKQAARFLSPFALRLKGCSVQPSRLVLRCRQFWYQANLHAQWWLRPKTTYRPLFVLATQRSGSNLLIDYLNRLGGVQSLAEILNRTLPEGLPRWQATPRSALAHIRVSLDTLQAPVRGCKLMLNQLDECKLDLKRLDAAFPEARYIILYRESLAEQFLSLEAAQATNQWKLTGEQEAKLVHIRVDPRKLSSFCDRTLEMYRRVLDHDWLRHRGILLSYEQLVSDPENCLREAICPLLEVETAPLSTSLRKQNTLSRAERIVNYDQVANLLDSPQCRQWLDWAS